MKNFKPELELNLNTFIFFLLTVEPRYNEVPTDWQNLFTVTRFCFIGIFSIYFTIAAEMPTSGDLKSGDSLFFTTPPEIQ